MNPSRMSPVGRIAFAVGVVSFVVFWTWALFFASKEAVNRIDDRAWAERAESICAAAEEEHRPVVVLTVSATKSCP